MRSRSRPSTDLVPSHQLFIKIPDQRGNSQPDADTASSMSISPGPSPKQLPDRVHQLSSMSEDGNSVVLGKNVSISPTLTNFKTPLPKQDVNSLKERLKSSAAKATASRVGSSGGYHPPPSNLANNNIQANAEVVVPTSYVQLSDSVQTSSSADQPFSPAVKRIVCHRRPAKPIKKIGAKGEF